MFHHNDVKEEPAGFSPASFSSESSSASAPQQPPLSKTREGTFGSPLGGMIGSPAVKPNVAGAAIRVMNAAEPGAMPGTPMGRGKASNAMTPRRVVAPAFTVASTSVASAAGVFPPGSARKQQTLARTVGLALADMTADPTNVTPRMQQMQISGGQGGVGELISFDDHAEGSGVKHRGVEIGVKAGRELEMVFGNAFSAPVPSNIGTSFTMLDVPSLAPPPAQLDPETTRLVEHRQGVLTGDFLLDAFHLGGEVPPLSTEAMIASAAETEANDIKAVTELENRLKPVMIGGDDFEPVVATDEEGEMDPDGIMTKIDELTDLEEKLEREILMMEEAFWKK
ncbi:hypothetical protein BC829DRAFT_389862 [Chytridium lagenaria]|nr:hypothetical protein BC829DRAFT_389862 [Chytridium lagenaria]